MDDQLMIPENFISYLPQWLQNPFLGVEGFAPWQIIYLILLVMASLVIRLVIINIVIKQINKIFTWLLDGKLSSTIESAAMPLGNLAMAGFLAMLISSIGLHTTMYNICIIALRTIAAISVVMLVYRSVDVLTSYLKHKANKTKNSLDDQLVPLISKALKIVTVILGAIFVLQNLNIDVTSLLAGVTIGGLAFTFAAKDTVSNLFGSVTIFADKPFVVGDWVKTAGVEGIIESVGFRSTRIRTFYNSLVTVPNNKFTEVVVDNLGLRVYRRSYSQIGITYATAPQQIEAFCNGIRAIIKSHPKTRKDYYEVHFNGFGDFSLNIMVYFFFKVDSWTDELRSKHEVFLDIVRLANELKINFAFPTTTLHVDSLPSHDAVVKKTPNKDELASSVAQFNKGGRSYIAPGPRVGEEYLAK